MSTEISRAIEREVPRWIRHRPSSGQGLAALGAGIGVGLLVGGVVFYLARLLLAREPLLPAPSRGEREAEGRRP